MSPADTTSVIVAGVRTPMGRLLGGLKDFSASDLGAVAIKGALEKAGVAPEQIDYVIMGQVLQAGAGQAPARQAAVGAGIPIDVPSDTVNKVCASSIRAVEIADSMIRAGDVEVVVTGGMESMTNAPYALPKARKGYRMGDGTLVDLMIWDGLRSTFDDLHMVEQAAKVARELGINEGTLGNWVNQYRRDHAGDEPPLNVSERARLREAERELRELRMENEFLKKAAAYFARDPR